MKKTAFVAGVATAFLILAPGAGLAATQTGGTDGPGDDPPMAAAAAMGVLALGGSGLVLVRRARRR
jgi:hypothetical protein